MRSYWESIVIDRHMLWGVGKEQDGFSLDNGGPLRTQHSVSAKLSLPPSSMVTKPRSLVARLHMWLWKRMQNLVVAGHVILN